MSPLISANSNALALRSIITDRDSNGSGNSTLTTAAVAGIAVAAAVIAIALFGALAWYTQKRGRARIVEQESQSILRGDVESRHRSTEEDYVRPGRVVKFSDEDMKAAQLPIPVSRPPTRSDSQGAAQMLPKKSSMRESSQRHSQSVQLNPAEDPINPFATVTPPLLVQDYDSDSKPPPVPQKEPPKTTGLRKEGATLSGDTLRPSIRPLPRLSSIPMEKEAVRASMRVPSFQQSRRQSQSQGLRGQAQEMPQMPPAQYHRIPIPEIPVPPIPALKRERKKSAVRSLYELEG